MPTRIKTSLQTTEFPVATGRFSTERNPITLIVLHTMVGYKAGTRAEFARAPYYDSSGRYRQGSAHYSVNMDGSIDHFLEETFTAYGAGNYEVNKSAINIEHEDFANPSITRSEALYQSASALIADICLFYQIPCTRDHIKKHNEIAATGCPGTLDVDRIIAMASEIIARLKPQAPPTTSTVLTPVQVNAAMVLKNALPTLKTKDGNLFGNEEGMARELVQEWPHYMQLIVAHKEAKGWIDRLSKLFGIS